MKSACALIGGMVLGLGSVVSAAPRYVWEAGPGLPGLSQQISGADLINGLVPLRNVELSAGFPLNTNGYVPIDNMPAENLCKPSPINSPSPVIDGFHGATPVPTGARLTDGLEGANVDSVLEDFAYPSAVLQFDLASATDIGEIRVFAKNTDARSFQDYDVFVSTDTNPDTKERVFTLLISEVITANYVCASIDGADGFAPNVWTDQHAATLTRVFDDANPVLAAGVTSIRFVFYPVDNTQGVFWDRWLGAGFNDCPTPSCGDSDARDHDGYKRPFVATIVKEIDVVATRGPFEICDNGQDDDGDSLIDAADPDCFGRSCPKEDCTNQIDDNRDGCTDCDDADCRDEAVCFVPEDCSNGIDDNGNELVDCDDPECVEFPACRPCHDPFADYDGDGDVDQADFGVLQRCFTGTTPGIPTFDDIVCHCFDRNGDNDIDQDDMTLFTKCASGPEVAAVAGCDD